MGESEAEKAAPFISANGGIRASQACDRCRMKKIKCDGGKPCSKCAAVGFDCTTSDKLSRRAFPKGYTVNLEKRVMELEEENQKLKAQMGVAPTIKAESSDSVPPKQDSKEARQGLKGDSKQDPVTVTNQKNTFTINNPIDQIFNLDKRGIIIGNDNLNYESQFNHLLINLRLPFLKITNSHNFLVNDPDSYLYHRSFMKYNDFHNKDLEVVYNPLTVRGQLRQSKSPLPVDVYELFLKLVNNFKKLFNSRRELDSQVIQFFLNYNTIIPIFDFADFMESYEAFHTMYPFMFTYGDATINGFNLSSNDEQVVNQYLMTVIQIYAMISINDPSLNLNLLLNHRSPGYSFNFRKPGNDSIIESLYEFLPYLNVLNVSMSQLQTYLLFLYYALLTNNKVKSLLLSSLVNAYIGILGVNMNSNNLFFNDLSLTLAQRRERVKIFWGFKVLLKCFNLKFGYKPTINTTVINPVTIERYFKLTPEKLSSLIDPTSTDYIDPLFKTLLAPSVEFLNLMNIVIPSSFSPNYYQYLKQDRDGDAPTHQSKRRHNNNLDWILNDDDGDGNDGNLNYNYTQFLTIDKNLSNWRYSLKDKLLDCLPLSTSMGLSVLSSIGETSLYNRITFDNGTSFKKYGLSQEGVLHFASTGLPDVQTAVQLIKMQLNFHYLLIRSMNYLNFVIDRELTYNYYVKIANISREVLGYFIMIFDHVGNANSEQIPASAFANTIYSGNRQMGLDSLTSSVDVDEDGFLINDFSVKRRKNVSTPKTSSFPAREVPSSPFNSMLNGLSLTMINIKKSIILQMLYLLICNLKISKKGGGMSADTLSILNSSITLFIKVFVNYQPGASKPMSAKKSREDVMFSKLLNDEMRADIMKSDDVDSDDEAEDNTGIDWDDEEMDEDLKYLKILKYIKYKTNSLYESGRKQRGTSNGASMSFANPRAAWKTEPFDRHAEGQVPSYLQSLPASYVGYPQPAKYGMSWEVDQRE